jgi:hypothetical protein
MALAAPFRLSQPTRFAGIAAGRARAVLAALAGLLLLCLTALAVPDPSAVPVERGAAAPASDLTLYAGIVAGVRAGGGYYQVASEALRAGDYPLRPFLTMRMPALAQVQASLPEEAPGALLVVLALLTGAAWWWRLAAVLPGRLSRIGLGLLLLGSLAAFLQRELAPFHELWAGLLIASGLALRRPGRWVEPVALGLAAMLIRETALLYAGLMAVFAWWEGERREALAWAAAIALFAVALAVHAYAVAGVTGPLDPASPGWAGLLGPGFTVRAMTLATALQLLPLWLAAPLVGAALFGWASWGDPAGKRVAAVLGGYGAVLALFARGDNFYGALLVAPLLLAGLAFVPAALGDLLRAARAGERPRITVTRVAR